MAKVSLNHTVSLWPLSPHDPLSINSTAQCSTVKGKVARKGGFPLVTGIHQHHWCAAVYPGINPLLKGMFKPTNNSFQHFSSFDLFIHHGWMNTGVEKTLHMSSCLVSFHCRTPAQTQHIHGKRNEERKRPSLDELKRKIFTDLDNNSNSDYSFTFMLKL